MNEIFNKQIIAQHIETIDNETIQIYVVEDGDYYNVYKITEKYRNDESNALDMQIPIHDNPVSIFTTEFFIERIMEYIIWDRFIKYGIAIVDLKIRFESCKY